jgi:hypothetical protein
MSESLPERLGRFTPDGSGLDRDALVFDAGRASVRPNRGWRLVAGALAASQLLTLALLWPRGPEPLPPRPGPGTVAVPRAPAEPAHPSERWALREHLLSEGELPPPEPVESLVPDGPPLRAFLVQSSPLLD